MECLQTEGNQMATAAAAVTLGWTRWFHCESTVDLSLVPKSPGLFAVGREGETERQLVIEKVESSEDLCHTLNNLLSAGAPLHKQGEKRSIVLRYASIPDAGSRQAALLELQAWLDGLTDGRSPFVKDFLWIRDSHPFRGASD
jgi:hypothetical protein